MEVVLGGVVGRNGKVVLDSVFNEVVEGVEGSLIRVDIVEDKDSLNRLQNLGGVERLLEYPTLFNTLNYLLVRERVSVGIVPDFLLVNQVESQYVDLVCSDVVLNTEVIHNTLDVQTASDEDGTLFGGFKQLLFERSMAEHHIVATEVGSIEMGFELFIHFVCLHLLQISPSISETAEGYLVLLYYLQSFGGTVDDVLASDEHSVDIGDDVGQSLHQVSNYKDQWPFLIYSSRRILMHTQRTIME